MSPYWHQAIPLVMAFFAFYCVAIRPGRRAEGKRYAAVVKLSGGERVVTSHGMFGTIAGVFRKASDTDGLEDEIEFDVEVAPGISVRIRQEGIKEIVAPASSPAAIPA